MMVPFVFAVMGLLITGYTMLFGTTVGERFSGFGVLVAAAILTGAYVSANFNGGKPYGFDVSIGVEPWRHDLAVQPASAPAKPEQQKPEESGTPMV